MAKAANPTVTMWNVRDAGALGDGVALDTAAIQSAIEACAVAGGGTVLVPPGRYVIGTVQLRSHVCLHLESGATLVSSTELANYLWPAPGEPKSRGRALIYAEGAERFSITGEGAIDGRGNVFHSSDRTSERWAKRPFLVRFVRCRDVQVRNVTLTESAFWTVHLFHCDTVLVDGVTIRNDRDRINTDGIDPDCSRNVRIANCHIDTGDDAICIKATGYMGEPADCENIVVTGCVLRTKCSALKLGNDLQGNIRNVLFSNNVIYDTPKGIDFTPRDRGSIDGVVITGTVMRLRSAPDRPRGDHAWPIMISLDAYRNRATGLEDMSRLGGVRNVLIADVVASGPGPCVIAGLPERPIENLTLRDVTLTLSGDYSGDVPKDWYSKYGPLFQDPAAFLFRDVRGLSVRNVRVQWDTPHEWPVISVERGEHLSLDAIQEGGRPVNVARPLIRLRSE